MNAIVNWNISFLLIAVEWFSQSYRKRLLQHGHSASSRVDLPKIGEVNTHCCKPSTFYNRCRSAQDR